MSVDHDTFFFFSLAHFQNDGVVSNDSSPPPPFQIPPVTIELPKGSPGQDVRPFFERKIIVIYITTGHAFKRQELRFHII